MAATGRRYASDAAFLAANVITHLKGAVVFDALVTNEDTEPELTILFRKPDGTVLAGTILRDPEGNGPGWVDLVTMGKEARETPTRVRPPE